MSADKEGRVERYLAARVHDLGGRAWKFTSPGAAGVPDRVCHAPGLPTIFVEVKAPGERLRPLQQEVVMQMSDRGALVFVVDSEARVEAVITEWQRLRRWWN